MGAVKNHPALRRFSRGIRRPAGNHFMKGRGGNDSLPGTTTNNKEHMKTLIKAGAMLAIIAGLGLATASAAESACAKCCKTSCSSCQKCSDGKCASCCKSCCK